jgi:hypothetical protein
MTIPLALLAAALACAQTSAPVSAQNPGPVAGASVSILKQRFISSTDDAERGKLVAQIAVTRPVTAQDVSSLFDLFSRFSDPGVRAKVMDSLALIDPSSPQLEPLFVSYLHQPEPETQLFGINGAFRLRSRQALPFVRKIAERKFEAADAGSISVLSQRNAWWTQYEALSALAQWEGEKALPLLRRKSDESPEVASLLGRFFWRQTFPDLKKWAEAADANSREKAVQAAGAKIEIAEARATRAGMLEIVRDPKADEEVRHRLALKAGAASNDAEVEALVQEHDKTGDETLRLLLVGAVSYSHSLKAVPLLARYARQSPDESMRKGARAELVDLVGESAAQALIEDKKDVKK